MKTSSIAKIARPSVSGTVKRDRLFHLLDQAKRKPVIWITAQGGSGKTTLVADWLESRELACLWYQIDEGDSDIASFFYYMGMAAKNAAPRYKNQLPLLTPEYLPGIPVFTRRYFEELFRRLASPSAKSDAEEYVVVLDNYQNVPLACGFHDMIAHGLDSIPPGMTFVILSRAAPPPQLTRLQANGRLHQINWDDVRFTREESLALLNSRDQSKTAPDTLEMLYEKTEGWAAGMILLTAGASSSAKPFTNLTSDKLFDYFASEIFSRTDAAVQDFLLKTSFLQKLNPAIAEQLTGNAMAGQILEDMSRNHYFTQKYDRTYQYHPLFRDFLQSRAKAHFPSTVMAVMRRRAAELLELAGNIEEAITLHIAAADWNNADRAINCLAPTLVAQGRSNTLETWLNNLPREHIERSAWMLYWSGIARMAYHPAEARDYLEKAFRNFKSGKVASGLFLSWASIIDTIVFEWSDFRPLDHWLAVAYELLDEYPEFPSAEIEARMTGGVLNVMTWRQRRHPDLPSWEERAKRIALSHPDNGVRVMLLGNLFNSHIWRGEIAKADLMMDALRPICESKEVSPMARLNWFTIETIRSWIAADRATCMQAVTQGLEYAQECGIHMLDFYLMGHGIYTLVTTGDTETARAYLKRMAAITPPRLIDQSFYHFLAASVAWSVGDHKKAIEHGELSVQIIEPTDCPLPHAESLTELSLTYFDDGQHEKALRLLSKAKALDHGMLFLSFAILMYEARFAFELGDEEGGGASLRQGLTLGSAQGYVNMFRWNNATMSRLCAKALEHGIETEYIRKLIKTRNLLPPATTSDSDAWPWPLKIYTLGRFAIVLEDRPVEYPGKVQQKPIELLKALIALGGTDVDYEQLTTALWPDAEGDKAYQSLEAALHRLRKLLGFEAAVLRQGNRVSLNPQYCWCDAIAFEKAADEVLSSPDLSGEPPQHACAIGMYRGNFLATDPGKNWAIALRERLGSKYVRLVKAAGDALERTGQLEQAIEHYHRALDSNPIAEDFYQRLILCYHRLGRQAEAISAYNRCHRVLSATIGVSPSPQTEAIYNTLIETAR